MIKEGIFIGDRYEIVEKVGAGGMADVFKAKDHKLNRYVAIKILKHELSEDTGFVAKFKAEAQSAAALSHPNIVNVYDVGDEGGTYYIVMELVEGITLKHYIEKKGQISVKESISIAIQVAMGIEAAHKNNIIHRDIKPQNIIISLEGKVKVADFGIARAASTNTINSNVMGSVHYSSPEQARGGYIDAKSDIYSLGISIYEMVTGRVPFDGETTVAIAIQHLQEEIVPPSQYCPEIPVSLEKIILKCTQKSLDKRYGNVGELIADLKRSLLNPEDDFVKLIPGLNGDKTLTIPDRDVKKIHQQTGRLPDGEAEEEEEYDEEYDGEYDEDEEDDDAELNPKLEKAITILGVVTGVIILGIVLYLALSFMGIFRGETGKTGNSQSSAQSISSQTDLSVSSEESGKKDQLMIDVRGMAYEEAKKKLEEKSIGIKKTGTKPSDTYPADTIMEQSISPASKVEANATLEVVISSGKEAFDLPNVIGRDETEAINVLTDQGLVCQRDYQYDDNVAYGKVISTTPKAGAAAQEGDTVSVIISRGKEVIETMVPDLHTLPESDALYSLDSAKLKKGNVVSQYHDTVAAGHVISQTPAYGTMVEEGTSVDYVLSLGPEPKPDPVYAYTVNLERPFDYDGGAVTVRLVGNTTGATLYSSQVTLPHSLNVSGIKGDETGTLTVDYSAEIEKKNEETGEVTKTREPRSSTQTVRFSQEN